MISIQGLSKSYSTQRIFEDVTFTVNPGERVGVVGRNGHGKTTLFRIIAGSELPDTGTITFQKDFRIGYLEQHIRFTKPTVLDEACTGLRADRATNEWRVCKVLVGLGFSEADFLRPPAEFSGGFQVRINLAKVLVSDPHCLLLDEPTNFLDIVSIRWLVRFICAWDGELLFISHDRGFMDSIATHIAGIHRARAKKISGKTSDYYGQVALEEEVYEKERMNTERKQRQMEEFISKFRAKARQANMVQSRIKTLEKMEKKDKLDAITTLSFSFRKADFPAKYVLEVRDLGFGYGDNTLISGFSIDVTARDRICVIGKNGKGKTTLLKLLAGGLEKKAGRIAFHPQVRMSYFEQANTAGLCDTLSVEEEIAASYPEAGRKAARDICGSMMFQGDNALKKIAVLSGGEKCRVLLGKIIAAPANLLLLDEPTHHLDMESGEALIDALNRFEGASIVVTHNERLLRAVAQKLIVFQKGRILVFHGTYDEFLERIGWEEEEDATPLSQQNQKKRDDKTVSRKDTRKARADFFTRRAKAINPLKQRLEEIETAIPSLEKRIETESHELVEASRVPDREEMVRLSKSIDHAREQIDSLYHEWHRTSEHYEAEKQLFDQEERALGLE
ncbi:MAG: ABC transporter ATP-binding protein [Candidatus Raymondbacteria bacterium RifOxyA12_full_50_37]|uniref:ABC transporter ATP-binding protein n=1 Tax=Candidatus Raymondbacteria bacterium RIFOXYD12_FULL_49_13 TaxID=1817890 RepID=A0A1F7FD89_UNCRA|nr:MAG: ABC transporter ATP-binding protein [Candidatus Raymondbacteria bacterium RifOxyA12_full_50_37]OGJ94109.1 MAG: ABC transporter ATP-binding protein [Candidatus Raymondbacteria bacterium RIFOXYA2_FULL_49_16]OGJ94314.1 MAG: ABC transporter ATP-binding protein [Candidatus Raymondbacteria bacterium RifOxyB12_full_50_8]OGJ96934.1 MAG: ABC transporter ATP-binding protein [Candidatus Raymondbacteria bacterium RIFOXYC2_FULL_50_21]OGK04660.1 MAG: ABC transporter ATP-binding protein [Candidatus Ra